jgi:orotate phosphoribosyltransferase
MNNIEDLIQKASELQSYGLVIGQIADELNVSKETVKWLLERSNKGKKTPAPIDISVNWNSIGKNAKRIHHVSLALCDLVYETLGKTNTDVDVVVGVAANGIPMAMMMAYELESDLAIYNRKEQDMVHESHKGTISGNFGSVNGKNCVIVDDVITTGTTSMELIELLREMDAKPMVVVVLMDKKGEDTISNVPIQSLVRIVRLD